MHEENNTESTEVVAGPVVPVDTEPVDESGGGSGDLDLSRLRWKCQIHKVSVEGSSKNYLPFCHQHMKKNGCKVVLVDKSDKVVATSYYDAQVKGIFPKANPYGRPPKSKDGPKPSQLPAKSEDGPKPSQLPAEEKGTVPKDGQPLYVGYFKTEKVPLSSRLLMQKEIFIQEGLVPPGISTSDFLEGLADTILKLTGRQIAIVQIKS